MARITISGIECELSSTPADAVPTAAYATWAAELGVPAESSIADMSADDGVWPVPLSRSVLGTSRLTCFASEGGLGLYQRSPGDLTRSSVNYPGVGRMYGFRSVADVFCTFHPDTDCESFGVKLQRGAEETIFAGTIRQYRSLTHSLDFAIRLAPGRVTFVLAPVDQPVTFKIFGAPGTAAVQSITLVPGDATEIVLSDFPHTDTSTTLPPLRRALQIVTGAPPVYGTPTLDTARRLSEEDGGVQDLRTGVLGKGVGRVYGTVARKTDPVNIPLKRKVRLVRERDGLVVRETWSDEVTGEYDFRYIDELQTWTVIAYDYEHNFRAVIADNITPETM